jgi:methionine sulfoxide reductase catalytic subunit
MVVMLIKKPDDIRSSEITDKKIYLSRRSIMHAGILAATTTVTGLLYRELFTLPQPAKRGEKIENVTNESIKEFSTNEPKTPYEDITSYNNFYEFATDKYSVATKAKDFRTRPWTIAIEGLVHKPKTYDLDQLLKLFSMEERIYRFRCVEGWSMVIPWIGFPLKDLINLVEPNSQAKYIEFQTLYDPNEMPGQSSRVLSWPYIEGLRLDEAMHPLTILATGLYGETLPPQNGAPLRLVVPWKYGFKSIKSIVKIRLVDNQPKTTWNIAAPDEYGFYSNVNPAVSHPRWSQARERRIGEFGMRETLPFNGYADQVASLYNGMDLKINF